MSIQPQGRAPYCPADTIKTVIDKHRAVGLPAPVTGDVLVRIGVPESLVPRTLQALRLLDLIDEKGAITDQLDLIGKTPPNDLPSRLEAWLRGVYAPIFDILDPATATPNDLENAFHGFEPRGQLARIISLFTGLCAYAGIMSEIPVKKPGPRPDGPRKRKIVRSKPAPDGSKGDGEGGSNGQQPNGSDGGGGAAPRGLSGEGADRYLALLLSKAEASDELDADLLDRIERVLGVAKGEQA